MSYTRRRFLIIAGGSAVADFIVVNMVAEAATGATSVARAMRKAERRAKLYYS